MIDDDSVSAFQLSGYHIHAAIHTHFSAIQGIAGIVTAEGIEIFQLYATHLQFCPRVLVRQIRTADEIQFQFGIGSQGSIDLHGITTVGCDVIACYFQRLDTILPLMFHRVIVVHQVMAGDLHFLRHPNKRLYIIRRRCHIIERIFRAHFIILIILSFSSFFFISRERVFQLSCTS